MYGVSRLISVDYKKARIAGEKFGEANSEWDSTDVEGKTRKRNPTSRYGSDTDDEDSVLTKIPKLSLVRHDNSESNLGAQSSSPQAHSSNSLQQHTPSIIGTQVSFLEEENSGNYNGNGSSSGFHDAMESDGEDAGFDTDQNQKQETPKRILSLSVVPRKTGLTPLQRKIEKSLETPEDLNIRGFMSHLLYQNNTILLTLRNLDSRIQKLENGNVSFSGTASVDCYLPRNPFQDWEAFTRFDQNLPDATGMSVVIKRQEIAKLSKKSIPNLADQQLDPYHLVLETIAIGGDNVTNRVNLILKRFFTEAMRRNVSLFGIKGNKNFSTTRTYIALKEVILAKREASEKDINIKIGNWLRRSTNKTADKNSNPGTNT